MEKRKKLVRTILIVLILLALCVIAWCGWYIYQNYKGSSLKDDIRGSFKETELTIDRRVEIPVDFDELQAINPDIYAWIMLDGTEVSYPILQREGDRSFYVRRSEAGVYYSGGCIFTEDYNSRDFTDRLTVIYGHNLRSGMMFAELNNYADAEYFKEHREFTVYLPDRALVYEVFAACPYSSNHLLANNDINDPAVYEKLFDNVLSSLDPKAHYLTDVRPDFDSDKLVCLSTCLQGNNRQRYLVFGRLVDEIPGV